MAENVIAAGAENRPSMLEKGMYDSWKTRIWLYIKGKENGEMFIDSIKNGPFQFKEVITVPGANGTADIWDRVKELMEGTEMTLQEHESKLYDEFDRFTFKPGELIHLYYWRFVTAAKQAKNLYKCNFDQLYAFLKQKENDAKEVREMRQLHPDQLALFANKYNPPPPYRSLRSYYNPPAEYHPHQLYQTVQSYQLIPPLSQQQFIQSPLQLNYDPPIAQQQLPELPTQLDYGFVVPSFLPTDDPVASLNKAMMFLSTTMNSKFPPTDNQLRTFQATGIRGVNNRVQDAEWFKEKMLLAQAHEAGVVLHEDQQDFLADRLEEMDD
ncbi:hypothetical protein Tco_1261919, partial [Tanacetum coccineum]